MSAVTPSAILCGLLLLVLIAALGLAFRKPTYAGEPLKFPEFNATVQGRSSSENVHAKSYGSPADPQHWRSSQFADEFEALVSAEHLAIDSKVLLARENGLYVNPEVQKQWDLWCKAIALTYAKTRDVDIR